MGYTHYWYRPVEFEAKTFALFSNDVQELLRRLPKRSLNAGRYYETCPLTLHGPYGEGEPIITSELISLNGDGSYRDGDNENMAHETFHLPRVFVPQSWQLPDPEEGNQYFDCCKTARKPYDLFVCACLMALKYHFPDTVVRSDGHEGDWFIAYTWYYDVFDREVPLGPWTPTNIVEEFIF